MNRLVCLLENSFKWVERFLFHDPEQGFRSKSVKGPSKNRNVYTDFLKGYLWVGLDELAIISYKREE